MASKSATYFLSAGRCGTQWLADSLQSVIGLDTAIVNHERIPKTWVPESANIRRYFSGSKLHEIYNNYNFLKYLDDVKSLIVTNDYIETGWPSFCFAPILLKEFQKNIKFVFLLKSPVEFAISLTTHDFYLREDNMAKESALLPSDPGTYLNGYWGALWSEMNHYEKCLFQWFQINSHILNFLETAGANYIVIKSEQLFSKSDRKTIDQMMSYIGYDDLSDAMIDKKKTVFDIHHAQTAACDWRTVFNFPKVVELAKQLGYNLNKIDDQKIKDRYFLKETPND